MGDLVLGDFGSRSALGESRGRIRVSGYFNCLCVKDGTEISGQFAGHVLGPERPQEIGQDLAGMHKPSARFASEGVSDWLGHEEADGGHRSHRPISPVEAKRLWPEGISAGW